MGEAEWAWPADADKAQAKADGQRIRWSLWADRYERFRLAGPGRSLLALYNAERIAKGQAPAKSVPGAWDAVAKAGDWRKRAAAWDLDQLLERRREKEAAERDLLHKAQQQRRRLMEAGYTLILEAMVRIKDDATDTQAVKVMAAIAKYLEHSRREYGETSEGLTTALELVAAPAPGEAHQARVVRELGVIKQAALGQGDLKLAMDAIRAERDVLGLDAPRQSRSEVSGPGGSAIQTQASQVTLYLPDNRREPGTDGDNSDGD